MLNRYGGEKNMTVEKQIKNDISEKKGFIEWVKENKIQLLLAGFCVSTLVATIIGLKNKDAIIALWDSLKEEIEKGALYSKRWFENANLEELEKAREKVRLEYVNPNLDIEYRNQCKNLLLRFDNAISNLKWDEKDFGYSVHSSNGLYLPSDD